MISILRYLSLFFLLILVITVPVKAEETGRNIYKITGALGADMPFSNGTDRLSPVIYGDFVYYSTSVQNAYYEIGADTTTVFCAFGIERNNCFAGIKPVWGHTVYGAYSDFYEGYSNSKNEIDGNFIGTELTFTYKLTVTVDSGISYLPCYRYYKTGDDTAIIKPGSLWEHNTGIRIRYKSLDEKDLGIIRHGTVAEARYQYSYRTGYSFQDRIMPDCSVPETRDNRSSHKYYLDLGIYYNFREDYNIKCELHGSVQYNTDRNNAEKVGSFTADSAVMPGYFYAEFYHDRYVINSIKFGIPLYLWNARIEPAFNLLYMPEENKVTGVADYPYEYYRSLSASLSLRIMNTLPLFADYAYGIDAERKKAENGTVTKGSHEVRAFVVFAFEKKAAD